MDTPPLDALVVGAGIAGLGAAWRLQCAGWRVQVLEAAPRVGGRMSTDRIDGQLVDRGAQFLSTGYARLAALAGELGLQHTLQPTAPTSALWREGRARRLRPHRALEAWTSGALHWREAAGWLRALWPARRALSALPLHDYAAWSAFDDVDSAHWLRQHPGPRQRALEPLLQGLYFQTPAQTSRALALMVSAFGWRGCRTTAPAGGMGRLPEALAQRLPVRLASPVRRLRLGPQGVIAETDDGTLQARTAICAVPAPQARALLAQADALEATLLQTPYSAGMNLALMFHPGLPLPPALAGCYGLLLPPCEGGPLAALAFEHAKAPDRATAGPLVHVMPTGDAAAALMERSDDEVAQALWPAVEALLPGARAHCRARHLVRWPLAMPMSPPGRARAVAAYREAAAGRRLLLAGDYLGAPFTEAALASGEWAAATLLAGHPGGAISTAAPAPRAAS